MEPSHIGVAAAVGVALLTLLGLALRQMEDRLVGAIDRLADRMDKLFESRLTDRAGWPPDYRV